MKWEASAPSNIALIKYMGKTLDGTNTGVNPSLSLTLNHLLSHVVIEENQLGYDEWKPLDGKMQLSETGKAKFLKHFQFLKTVFKISDRYFTLLSKNDFPSDCGIASSASSFAALTKAACAAFAELSGKTLSLREQATLSRHGSGSSCRSFFDGFVEWDGADGIRPLETGSFDFIHQVFIVSSGVKTVSSSQAHQRVATSDLMIGRIERAQKRFVKTKNILTGKLAWQELFDLCWAEFWDMHALFETAQPPFGYMAPASLEILTKARQLWQNDNDGPIVTMDAGPNVHLLWRSEQKEQARRFESESPFKVLSNMGRV